MHHLKGFFSPLIIVLISWMTLQANDNVPPISSSRILKNVLKKPVEIAVVSASYNNEKWAKTHLESLAKQTYPYVHFYYINDASTDKTGKIVDAFIRERKLQKKFTVIHNKKRKGSLANLYSVINRLPGHVVVASVDGDDFLKSPSSLETLASVYADKKVWMTYGSFESEPAKRYPNICHPFPEHIVKNCAFRKYDWTSSHLKTFYAKLFQKIKKESLQMNGEFYEMAGDLAFMFPMLEMASKGHIRYIDKILYVYRVNNPLNDFKVNQNLCVTLDQHIRSMKPYKPLQYLFSREDL